MCSAPLDVLRAQKIKESKSLAEAATHSVQYDLCALYVLCNPVSLSLYNRCLIELPLGCLCASPQ